LTILLWFNILLFYIQEESMSRIMKAKGKIVRRLGVNIYEIPKYERLLKRKSNPPGRDRPGRKKLSNYGMQLKEKQKLRFAYGISETQFRNIYKKARSMTGLTGDTMVEMLERRLDNTVFRLGLASSRSQARQFVSHGHIRLNNKRATIPSQLVGIGDEVAVSRKESSRKMVNSFMSETQRKTYSWLSRDEDELKGKYLTAPAVKELPLQVDLQMVVEFYAR
jgi:small subunit ribosomal protein S4